MLSEAPIRMNIESKIPIVALEHGRRQPICVMIANNAICFTYEDLPPMLGPVMINTRLSSVDNLMSFGTYCPLF